MTTKHFLYSLLILSSVSCKPKLSGDTEDGLTASLLVVKKELNVTEQEKLDNAIGVIGLYAMKEKWEHPDNHPNQSITAITLSTLNNKSYDAVVNFAEDFIETLNQDKIDALESEILKLDAQRKKTDSVITLLDGFKPSDILIKKDNWGEPNLYLKIKNTNNLKDITNYMFTVKLYSIAQDKLILSTGSGSSFEDGNTLVNDQFFCNISASLASIIQNSRRLQKLQPTFNYPITDLAQYDLRVQIITSQIRLKDRTTYDYPEQNPELIQEQIQALKDQIQTLKNTNNSLDNFSQEADDTNDQTPAFNEDYLADLEVIRKKPVNQLERIKKVKPNLNLTFPANYDVKKKAIGGMYIFSLSDSLVFDNSNKDLIQYQIQDTTYIEYQDSYNKPNGKLLILNNPTVAYDFKETMDAVIEEAQRMHTIDADASGYMYQIINNYKLVRYFKIQNDHYLYTMDFKNLEDCVKEFDRSKNMIQ
ncbi:hypothetical protein [Psychroserpens sp. NJDZ02]|uniref:hypothetical protein n=1 Tax=Psychroserpens sp. NJDZ02 TaxID=2570561 RepID=UPI0010A7CC1F|nr:hypothetical protein [Psychroserpens sp. NJDZ02]QCE43025.1 hypothetical protein E9099_16910 [Psychroserpens sp. NJDZ02]